MANDSDPVGTGVRKSLIDADSLVDNIDRESMSQQRLVKVLAPKLEVELRAARKLRKQVKARFERLSGLKAVRRVDSRFVPTTDPLTVRKVHDAAMAEGLGRLADRYRGQLRLALSSDELRAIGLDDHDGGVSQVPVGTLDDLLARRGVSGCDLIRTRPLLDGVRIIGEPGADAPPDPGAVATPSDPGSASATPTQVAAMTQEQAGQLMLEGVAAKLREQQVADAGSIGARPDAPTVSLAINALELSGGPADATAFHDLKVLRLAFPDVWSEAFDAQVRGLGEELYRLAVQHYAEMDQTVPPLEAIEDITALKEFIAEVSAETGIPAEAPASSSGNPFSIGVSCGAAGVHSSEPAPAVSPLGWSELPTEVVAAFSDLVTPTVWRILSTAQQLLVRQQAVLFNEARDGSPSSWTVRQQARGMVQAIVAHPAGPGGRLAQLMYELNKRLLERYSFELFAPGSYNFGLLLTYRQKWEPITYQAGDLVATIPLAPGEVRRYSTRKVSKRSRAEKEVARSTAFRTQDVSRTERAEAEIMRKATQATNFSMTAQGSFSIGLVDVTASSNFGANQGLDSVDTKKDFHEATLKAAEQYRKENSLEVDSALAIETEETSSGEISNPNNEITVTYLFYELQRRYRVSEQLHRAQAVILVAQEMPAPHEIDEAFLVANQWILSRYLLDESLRPALDYLTSGLAGDEVALGVQHAHWVAQKSLLDKLEQSAATQIGLRDALRTALAQAVLGKSMAEAMSPSTTQQVVAGILSGGVSLLFPGGAGEVAADLPEARRKAVETRLQYAEDAVADLQSKLQAATQAYAAATQAYAEALSRSYARRVSIDQLRVHVKDNILHYMHGIWDSEPPDQRYFRLHATRIALPGPQPGVAAAVRMACASSTSGTVNTGHPVSSDVSVTYPPPTYGRPDVPTVALAELADLDRPLGFKGNYIMFPLKQPTYLTSYMLQEYVDSQYGLRDPDDLGNWPLSEVAQAIRAHDRPGRAGASALPDRQSLLDRHAALLADPRATADDVIVPTGQLFVEALPGRHPLIEDFKLRHRLEDVRRVQAEVRHTELENLRLAARLLAGEREDPEIQRRIVVDRELARPDAVVTEVAVHDGDPARAARVDV